MSDGSHREIRQPKYGLAWLAKMTSAGLEEFLEDKDREIKRLKRAREPMECGHANFYTDSYGGCGICIMHQEIADLEKENAELTASVETLYDLAYHRSRNFHAACDHQTSFETCPVQVLSLIHI